jgi:hypothetical protein
MSCCGQKRTEWLNEVKNAASPDRIDAVQEHQGNDRQPGLFEYTGMRSLTVRGVHSGILYRFNFPGEKVEILYEDTFALMAEPDLKFVGPHRTHQVRGLAR